MSVQSHKRRQPSSSSSNYHYSPNKKQRSLPRKVNQSPTIMQRFGKVIGNFFQKQDAGPPSPTSSSYESRSDSNADGVSPLFEVNPNGILAVIDAFDSSNPNSTSVSASSILNEGGTANSPVDLTADDDDDDDGNNNETVQQQSYRVIQQTAQAGPSRPRQSPLSPNLFPENFSQLPTPPASQEQLDVVSHPTSTRQLPSRPDVRNYQKPHRSKAWERNGPSPTPSETSSRSSSGRRKRKYRSTNLRDRQNKEKKHILAAIKQLPITDKAAKRVQNMFIGRTPQNPSESTMNLLVQNGLGSKFAFRKMLETHATRTLDEQTSLKDIKQDPVVWRKTGQNAKAKASAMNLSGMRKELEALRKVEDEEAERKLQERLKPKIPAKLSADQEATVAKHLRDPSFKSQCSPLEEVGGQSLQRLKPSSWLNDELVNSYCALMKQRANDSGKRKVHYFNSFFYQKLSTQGYEGAKLKRWTKKLDIFDLDVLIFPVNIGNMHWTAGAINFERKRIEYYDSMGDCPGHHQALFRNIRTYLDAEHKEKKGKKFDFTGWENCFNEETPQQDNGSDCGVFSCQTLEMITRGRDIVEDGFEFTASNMPFFRRLMIWEFGKANLEKRTWGQPAL